MSSTIRLARLGRKKHPQYRIVVADVRMPRDGRFIEMVGIYQPLEEPARVEIDAERVLHHYKCGASVSDTVRRLCVKKGIKLER